MTLETPHRVTFFSDAYVPSRLNSSHPHPRELTNKDGISFLLATLLNILYSTRTNTFHHRVNRTATTQFKSRQSYKLSPPSKQPQVKLLRRVYNFFFIACSLKMHFRLLRSDSSTISRIALPLQRVNALCSVKTNNLFKN